MAADLGKRSTAPGDGGEWGIVMNPASMPVPQRVADRARELAAGRVRPADPRPAATVVLVRDSEAGPQLYLIRRRASMAFAGGMYAFPGGRVDGDEDSRTAALRELFEETSVLLAARETTPEPLTDTTFLEAERRAVAAREADFGEMLARHRLIARTDLLVPSAHWITPEAEERRYDTVFYLAAMPPGQRARDVSGEADRAGWWTPGEVEDALASGAIRMMPPTVATVASLAAYRTVADAVADVATWEVPTISPTVGFDDAGEPFWRLG